MLSAGIRSAATDELLGHLVLYGIDRGAGRCELGFWLRPEARGAGAAGRAAELACRFAFESLGLARVQAVADIENVASQRTLERAGFAREGLLRSYNPTPSGGRMDVFVYGRVR
jgi:RimJ/RimL family protein N-acetyltransferase